MAIKRITEGGVAVRNLDQATQMFSSLFDAEVGDLIEVAEFGMRYRMCRIGKVDFELMEPTDDDGVIARFLAKRGEGLHHVAFAVDDIKDTMNTLAAKHVRFVDTQPIAKALPTIDYAGRHFTDDIQFTFSLPASILGILFEFIQYPEGYATP